MSILDLLHELEDAAKKEDWEKIDKELIPKIRAAKSMYAVQRAIYKLQDENAHVRDVAATIIQNGYDFSSQEWLEMPEKERVVAHMVKRIESNPAVRYRLAIAFAKNGVGRYGGLVKRTLEEAANDKYVGEEAAQLLNSLFRE